MSTNRAVAALTITGFNCDPDEVSGQLEMKPTKVWRAGDPVVASRPEARKHRENGWRYAVQVADTDEEAELGLERALQKLVRVISTNQSCFVHLPSEASVELSCYLRIDGETRPVISFNKDAVRLIAAIGASIDVDLVVA